MVVLLLMIVSRQGLDFIGRLQKTKRWKIPIVGHKNRPETNITKNEWNLSFTRVFYGILKDV